MAADPETSKPRLIVRQADFNDIKGIRDLSARAYPDDIPYGTAALRGQQVNFSEGQFVAVYEDRIVGHAATFRISERLAFAPHSWWEITGGGFASRHEPNGDWLYGMEVCVDPEYRGLRIGQRLYRERRKLCERQNLKGIIIAGRLPGLARRISKVGSAQNYVEMVKHKQLRDPTLSFQMRNGFEVVQVLKDYLPEDRPSLGYAALMMWRNPERPQPSEGDRRSERESSGRVPHAIRIGTVQYQQRRVESFEEFGHNVEYFVDVVADYSGDFVVFPELFTLQLLSIENSPVPPDEAVAALTQYTERYRTLLSELAIKYNINIIGGSHPTRAEDGRLVNIAYAFLRDGSVHEQPKIHPTPNERYWWRIEGGESLNVIQTDCGPIGILICYDCEFPELARHLIDQGAQMIFVPFCTDERQSYLRVRYCAQARAVENQCYVVLSGNVGNLPGVENMDIQYGQSCILTPCDFTFARDGIAADTTPNVETVAIADLHPRDLMLARQDGTVQNLRDRRFDLYGVSWRRD